MFVLKVKSGYTRDLLRQMERILVLRDPEASNLKIKIDFENLNFVSPIVLAIIVAFIEKLRLRHDVKVDCCNLSSTNSDYIARMDFFNEVGFSYLENFNRHDGSGRFIPITRITEKNYMTMTSKLTRIIQEQWEGVDDSVVGALDWSLAEIIDNVFNHSKTRIDGFVTAQYFPSRNRIDFAVIDGGIGIPRRLRSRAIYNHFSACEALEHAVEQDVTVDPENNKGAGLYYTKRIIEENRGILRINSDKAELLVNGKHKNVGEAPKWSGTVVQLRIKTNNAVDPECIWGNTPASFEAIMERDRELW